MIKIITDSTIYIKKQEAEELGIRIVPVFYTANGNPYLESYSDQNGNFEELLKSNRSFATSQPNPAAFLSTYEEELALGNEVLCITMSSRLSGTYNAAYVAAKQTESKKVFVFDSHLTAGGLYLLVIEAKKLVDKGENIRNIIHRLTEIRMKITVAFSVDDMTPLRNSRRIGFVRMNVGTFLNIKPILLCKDGVVVSDSIARGNIEIIKKLISKIVPNAKEIIINYISNNRIACDLYNIVKEKYPYMNVKLMKIGPVLGIHLGSEMLAISFIEE
ncbi:MAG: hypothetical protein DBX47_05445 [Clostridiales bacterium]|nr:MAG: hypothetical protein DBX47_05445 [Clostridiales bacterium]